jgi:hypothetical protein
VEISSHNENGELRLERRETKDLKSHPEMNVVAYSNNDVIIFILYIPLLAEATYGLFLEL